MIGMKSRETKGFVNGNENQLPATAGRAHPPITPVFEHGRRADSRYRTPATRRTEEAFSRNREPARELFPATYGNLRSLSLNENRAKFPLCFTTLVTITAKGKQLQQLVRQSICHDSNYPAFGGRMPATRKQFIEWHLRALEIVRHKLTAKERCQLRECQGAFATCGDIPATAYRVLEKLYRKSANWRS
jgi:hypothetical protein